MGLGPLPDRREPGPERVGDDVVGAPDEDRPVADARESGDVLDHLGVQVGREERLALAPVRHRQPADEVGEPAVRGRLQLRVLVQEVVDLPALVGDPHVVRLHLHEVVEDHEVRDQDLVHPPDRLEHMQIVVGRLRGDVGRLARQAGRRGMDALAAGLEDAGHGILGQPVDLEVGMEPPQLVGDRDVAPRVPEPDRRGDVEGALRPPHRARPVSGSGTLGGHRAPGAPKQQVRAHRVAGRAGRGPSRPCSRGPTPAPRRSSGRGRPPRADPRFHGSRRRARDPPGGAVASARSITLSFQPRKLSSMVSASVSSDQSTASSICFVECGSLKHSPKKNSVYPRQSRSQ